MPKKKPVKPRRRSRKKPAGRQLKILLASLALVGFLLACLVILAVLRPEIQPAPTDYAAYRRPLGPPSTAPAPPLAPAVPSWSPPALPPVAEPLSPAPADAPGDPGDAPLALEALQGELSGALVAGGIPAERIRTVFDEGLAILEVHDDLPGAPVLDALDRQAQRLSPPGRVVASPQGDALQVLQDGRVLCLLRFLPVPAAPVLPPVVRPDRPRVAIIMDDLGQDLRSARTLLDIDLAVTFAIIPHNEQAPQVAALAHRHGREVLVHMPMEPQGYPAVNPGVDALFVALSDAEIRHRVLGYLARVPHAVGGNNHMGSQFTQSREKMAVVVDELRKAGLFFVDSRTSSASVAFAVAREAGVPAAGRDVFLDNVQDEKLIAREIRRLVEVALKKGQAVGICHPYPQTMAALRREAEYIRAQGVEVVPASQLLIR